MIKRAAEFARQVHEGKMRKGTTVPYIVHPLDAAVIVSGLTKDPEVISAALLHDVIEDAGVTYECLLKEFGKRVADLVRAESEDKSGTWMERKQATIDHLLTASRDEKIICLGDKLSNLRSTASDRLLKGENVWLKFRVKEKASHEWYYGSIMERLQEFRETPAYMEYEQLFHELFDDTDNNK